MTQFDSGYQRAEHIIRIHNDADIVLLLANEYNRPMISDTSEFKEGYAKRSREAFEAAGILTITRERFIQARGREPEGEDLVRFVHGFF